MRVVPARDDAPGCIVAMLSLLQWIDLHPETYWAVAFGVSALAWVALFALRVLRGCPTRTASWVFGLIVFALLLAWRWPQLLSPHEFNPDESQFIAGAQTLRQDPVFWRSVDGMTAGPLIFYTLVPFAWLGLPLDFFTARLAAILLLTVMFALAHRLVAHHHGLRAATLAALPLVCFAAVATSTDFTHYSSELVPGVILAAAALALFAPPAPSVWRCLVGGVIAGLAPWAKLQSAPIAAVIVVLAVVARARDLDRPARGRLRNIGVLCAGTMIPAILVLAGLAAAGLLPEFYSSYVVQNLFYTEPTLHFDGPSRFTVLDAPLVGFLVAAGTVIGAAATAAVVPARGHELRRLGYFGLIVGVLSVLFPGRDFLHYLLLLLPALVWLAGSACGELLAWSPQRRGPRLVRAGALCLPLLATLFALAERPSRPRPPVLGRLAWYWAQPFTELGTLVRHLAAPDRSVAIWGWRMDVYVEARARHATRSAYNYWELTPSPQRDRFRQRYLADFLRNSPTVFLDAVGPHSQFLEDRLHQGHEVFPELAAVVRRDYALVADLGHARVYARRELLAARKLGQDQVRTALARGRRESPRDRFPREDLNRLPLPKHVVHGRFVAMLPPGREAVWELAGPEREFHFDFGYAPPAERQTEGNGTVFTVSVTEPDGSAHVLASFLYNPAHVVADRLPQTRQLVLPMVPPGSRLVVRADPGPFGDDAWDWAYLADVRFVRNHQPSFRLFPGFNRPPDQIVERGEPVSVGAESTEATPGMPPAFAFVLRGDERTLDFGYGVLQAVLPDERVSFTARLHMPGHPPRTLFARDLRPIGAPAEAQEQYLRLVLPPVIAGARLEVRQVSHATSGTAFGYIRDLRLD